MQRYHYKSIPSNSLFKRKLFLDARDKLNIFTELNNHWEKYENISLQNLVERVFIIFKIIWITIIVYTIKELKYILH